VKLSKLISYISHPFIMPLIGALIIFQSGAWVSYLSGEAKQYVLLVTFTATAILPFASNLFMKYRGVITHVLFLKGKEKRIPLMLCSFFTLIGAFVLQKVSAPLVFPIYLNGLSIVILITALLSGFWNISTHMLQLGGLTGLVLAIALNWMIDLRLILGGLILLAGVTASAQLKLEHHNTLQLIVGFLLGFLVVFLTIRLI